MENLTTPQWNFSHQIYIGIGVLLLIAVLPMPYSFYIFLRFIIPIFAGILCYQNFNVSNNKSIWPWLFLIIAILFNPIIPIYMQKEAWVIIDISLGLFFLWLAHKTKNIETKDE